METEDLIVNLDMPPEKRWGFLVDYKKEINELLQCYLNDFEGADLLFKNVEEYKRKVIPTDYLKEIDFISSISSFSPNEVLIANLYYDVLKFYFGCTAFALDNGQTIMHSRNLDWHTDNNLLSEYSTIFNFQRKGETTYKTVGWPGFIGALSGLKPGKFAITLNAVLSNDSPEFAYPVSFLIRDILDSENSFEDASNKLETTTIASDCLLLLSGTSPNEMVVIERTPKRSATREHGEGFIIVTNDYKKLTNMPTGNSNILQATSCGRYDRAKELLNQRKTHTLDDCLTLLSDEEVMMNITVQQMAFDNKTGEIKLIKT